MIRPATPEDAERLCELMRELAVYEKLEHVYENTPARIRECFFGADPVARALAAVIDGTVYGYAVFFRTYSTFAGNAALWLEDIYVTPSHRGTGMGKALLQAVAGECVALGYSRMDWAVLNWNQLAIDFYTRTGADVMDDWRVCRLAGEPLVAFSQVEAAFSQVEKWKVDKVESK